MSRHPCADPSAGAVPMTAFQSQSNPCVRSAASPADLEALRNRLDPIVDQADGRQERLEYLEQEKGGPLH